MVLAIPNWRRQCKKVILDHSVYQCAQAALQSGEMAKTLVTFCSGKNTSADQYVHQNNILAWQTARLTLQEWSPPQETKAANGRIYFRFPVNKLNVDRPLDR